MSKVIERSIGAAGSGKTTLLLDKLSDLKDSMRLQPEQVGLCTFTRAGRQEISERAAERWGCDTDRLTKTGWFRTAHSIAHRQCGVSKGQLIEGDEGAQWISDAIGGSLSTKFDPRANAITYVSIDGNNSAALSLKAWDIARARGVSLDRVISDWHRIGDQSLDVDAARIIINRYELAKIRDGRIDYTDMIARFAGIRYSLDGARFVEPEGDVPEDIRVLAIDEAQDSSVLVDRVCRRLAESPHVEYVMIAGDPFQSIHGFAGGDYRLFLSWQATQSVMPRSYRCPRVVQELGERCLQRMHEGYFARDVAPAPHDGSVDRLGSVAEAMSLLDPAEPTLILGRCGFCLNPYEEALKDAGIPYSWIDRAHSQSQAAGYNALWRLQHGKVVNHDGWQAAVAMIAVNKDEKSMLRRGEKTAWAEGRRYDVDVIRPVREDIELAGGTADLHEMIVSGTWTEAMEPRLVEKAQRWFGFAKRFGPEVASEPKVRLSTIHSAKGCEGDTVILSTTSSRSVESARINLPESHDEECRVAYVAVTRARRRLLICDDGGYEKMEFPL